MGEQKSTESKVNVYNLAMKVNLWVNLTRLNDTQIDGKTFWLCLEGVSERH